MQQIVYREFPLLPDQHTGDNSVDPNTIPTPEDVGGMCGMMQTWAQENGWRIVSVTPVTGLRRKRVNHRSYDLPAHTVGFVFVCDKL